MKKAVLIRRAESVSPLTMAVPATRKYLQLILWRMDQAAKLEEKLKHFCELAFYDDDATWYAKDLLPKGEPGPVIANKAALDQQKVAPVDIVLMCIMNGNVYWRAYAEPTTCSIETTLLERCDVERLLKELEEAR